jgi:alpha-tubulin suppressor-like RCC1 family protein
MMIYSSLHKNLTTSTKKNKPASKNGTVTQTMNRGCLFTRGSNGVGQLGDGTISQNNLPKAISIPGLETAETITKIDSGSEHSLALTSAGKLYSWGSNEFGQLGDGTVIDKSTPTIVRISGLQSGDEINNISAGGMHSMILTKYSRLYSWGDNNSGQIGDGTPTQQKRPVLISFHY